MNSKALATNIFSSAIFIESLVGKERGEFVNSLTSVEERKADRNAAVSGDMFFRSLSYGMLRA
jgi:hypothetical protein